MPATGVPEAAIDEDGHPGAPEHEIGPTVDAGRVQGEAAQSRGAERRREGPLDRCAATRNRRHHPRAPLGRHGIHAGIIGA